MRPELRDEAVQTLGTVAERAGYERGLLAALEAVQKNLTTKELRELDDVRDGFLAIEVADIGKEIAEERLLRLIEREEGEK